MLSLEFLFEEAIQAMRKNSARLSVIPLPAAIYMMQVDLINHYRHALDHYFTVPLTAHFLQDSSIGTPYQKWAYFTNEDFELLSFTVHNLLRYTSRLIHDIDTQTKAHSNLFTSLICEIKYGGKRPGIFVHDNNSLTLTPLHVSPSIGNLIMRGDGKGPSKFFLQWTDESGQKQEQRIEKEEFDRRQSQIRPETIEIGDRSVLKSLHDRGIVEIDGLVEKNRTFADICSQFYGSRNVAEPFRSLHASYWI